jgi:hypothetical protein
VLPPGARDFSRCRDIRGARITFFCSEAWEFFDGIADPRAQEKSPAQKIWAQPGHG